MPKLMTETEKMLNRNRYLEGRVVHMFNEIYHIDKYAKSGEM